jgi:CubicO group peptidase (beta-lactamase class C family)
MTRKTASTMAGTVLLPLLCLAAGAPLPANAQVGQDGLQAAEETALLATLDSLARAHVEHERVAGVSVAVVRGPETLLLGGYGEVDLEWNVPTPRDGDANYEIGSMTKQFTAAAILRLVEEGAVDLEADITRYLPDYDTRGHAIPVRRLLDHTSGIRGYTEMPFFGEISVRKLPRDTLVTLVEAHPLDFEPGTALIYSNSAYFLLGLIIEEVSGKTYAEYVEQELFEPAGMADSHYCSERAVRENRAHGYDSGPDGLLRAAYLDHTWPYAAGSLCSTVADLVRWNQALHGGEILSVDSYRAMITPRPLKDGTPTRYAMGLLVTGEGRHRAISHGGGINGFLSDGRYYPEEDLIVVALQNSTGPRGPGALTRQLAQAVLGPAPEPPATTFRGDLAELTGRYTGAARGRTLTLEVRRDGDALIFAVEGTDQEIRPTHLEGLTWGQGLLRLWFIRKNGEIAELRLDEGSSHLVLEREEGK